MISFIFSICQMRPSSFLNEFMKNLLIFDDLRRRIRMIDGSVIHSTNSRWRLGELSNVKLGIFNEHAV